MTHDRSRRWVDPAIRVASAGLGAAVAGPLGLAIGSWVGAAVGSSAAALVESYAEKFGEKAAEKVFEVGADSIIEKLKKPVPLESLYREALRLSLSEIRSDGSLAQFADWFASWDACLADSMPLELSSVGMDHLVPGKLDDLFRKTMERIDAQGAAIRRNDLSFTKGFRTMPDDLFSELQAWLPKSLQRQFSALIVEPKYEEAWRQTELIFQRLTAEALRRIEAATQGIDIKLGSLPQVAQDVSAIREMVKKQYDMALREGRIESEQLQAKNAEIARLTEELRKLQVQLAARASEPGEAKLSQMLAAGDFEGALQLKTKQLAARRREAEKLPRDLFELATIYELRFDWPQALAAYREAWRLEQNPEYGFQYAYLAAKQKQFSAAIGVFEILRTKYTAAPDIASTLNNLAVLFSDTHRMKEAEEAYQEAISIYRDLARDNTEAYLPNVAGTLNNLANLYSDTQRMKEAEGAYEEALSTYRSLAEKNPEAYLPDVTGTLNNLALLYSTTQRMKEAEGAYQEALSTYRKLAKDNPEAYLPDVAMTLNNLAILYSDTQRMKEAEEAYQEALSIRRKLAKDNPEAYLPDVAMTLNNLANLYRATQRMKEAEEAFQEALSTYRKLAQDNPQAYLPNVATTLNNLAILYRETQRRKEAVGSCHEAAKLLEPQWQANPEVHGDQLARILLLLVLLSESGGESAGDPCAFARRAFEVAYQPDLKRVAIELINQLCEEGRP